MNMMDDKTSTATQNVLEKLKIRKIEAAARGSFLHFSDFLEDPSPRYLSPWIVEMSRNLLKVFASSIFHFPLAALQIE
jgi:hypothetical protein